MKVWKRYEIERLLKRSDKAVKHAILCLYSRQTEEERCASNTLSQNNKGFNAFDAPFLSGIAQQLKKSDYLSPKLISICRRRIMKYAGQLTQVANNNEINKVRRLA